MDIETRIKAALAELEKADAGVNNAKGNTIVPLYHLGELLEELWRESKKGWLEKAKAWGVKKDNAYRAIDFRAYFQTEEKAKAFTGGFRELGKAVKNDRAKNPQNYPWAVPRLKKTVKPNIPPRIGDLRDLAGQVATSILDGTADANTKAEWGGFVSFVKEADAELERDGTASPVLETDGADNDHAVPDAAAKAEPALGIGVPIDEVSLALQRFIAVDKEFDANPDPADEDYDRHEAARLGVLEAIAEKRQEQAEEKRNRELHEQKTAVEDAVKALADLEKKVPTIRNDYKKKLHTVLKYLQQLAAKLDV